MKARIKSKSKFPFTFEEVGNMVERQEGEVHRLMEIKRHGLNKTIKEAREMHRTLNTIWKAMKNPAEN